MVVSMAAIYSAMSELQGVNQYQELIDFEFLKMGGWLATEMTPHLSAPEVKIPVLIIQVLETHGQGIKEALSRSVRDPLIVDVEVEKLRLQVGGVR
jgi:hypothetical protein